MRKVLVWLPVLVMAFAIFGFSGQGGEQSGGLSHKVAAVLVDGAEALYLVRADDDGRETMIEQLQFPIRKGAHMAEYALLGTLLYIAFAVNGVHFRYRGRFSLSAAFLFACTDELHQLFVPGRSGRFQDVLIDTAGCLIAVLFCRAIDRRRKNC